MIKKFLAALAAAVLITVPAYAEETPSPTEVPTGYIGGTLTDTASWELIGNVLKIKGTGRISDFYTGAFAMAEDAVPWYQYTNRIRQAIIEEGITNVPGFAFGLCENLTSVTLPSTLTAVGPRAFYACDGLEELTLPSGIKNIKLEAFMNCDNLRTVELPDSLEELGINAFYNCVALESIEIPSGVTTLSSKTFYNCTKLNEVKLNDGLINIGIECFFNCPSLTAITLPDTLNRICERAFYDSSLRSVVIPDSVRLIHSYAFANSSLSKLTLGAGAKYFTNVFYGCNSLKEVHLPSGDYSAASYMFDDCRSLKTVTIDESVSGLAPYMFCGCKSLDTLTLSPLLNEISEGAFAYCTSLDNVIIPDSAVTIDEFAFSGCTALKNLTLSDNITHINQRAFSECTSLTIDRLPDKLTYIGHNAFSGVKFGAITFPKSLKTIGISAFAFAEFNNTLEFPPTITKIENGAFANAKISQAVFDGTILDWIEIAGYYNDAITGKITFSEPVGGECGENVKWELSSDLKTLTLSGKGATYSYGKSNITSYALTTPWMVGGDHIEKVVIGEGITKTGEYCLGALSSLKEVIMPSTLTELGAYTFYNDTALEEIDFTYLTNIGSYAFAGCRSLRYAELVKTTGNYVFSGCRSLQRIKVREDCTNIKEGTFFNCTSLACVSLPGGLRTIGAYAFSGCENIGPIFVASSVRSIGDSAFEDSSVIIYCRKDSTAQLYASKNNIEYVETDGSLISTTTDAVVLCEDSLITVYPTEKASSPYVFYEVEYDSRGRLKSVSSSDMRLTGDKAVFSIRSGREYMLWDEDNRPLMFKTEIEK